MLQPVQLFMNNNPIIIQCAVSEAQWSIQGWFFPKFFFPEKRKKEESFVQMMEIIYYIIEVRSNRVSKLNKTIALSSVHCFPFVSFPLFFSFLHVTSAIVEIIFIARRKWHAHLFAFWTFYSAPFIIIFWRVYARERKRERVNEELDHKYGYIRWKTCKQTCENSREHRFL